MPGRRGKNKDGTEDQRGGPRTPENPAALSGPGAASERTDRGLDLTGFDAERHGQRQQVEQAAGLTGGGGQGQLSPPSQRPSPQPQQRPFNFDVFRPAEEGEGDRNFAYQLGEGLVPDDPDTLLRAMWEESNHPDILRLLSYRRARTI